MKGGALRAARRRGAQARRGARRTLTWSAALPSWRDPEHVNVVGREGVAPACVKPLQSSSGTRLARRLARVEGRRTP